jgi:hypothetical protein
MPPHAASLLHRIKTVLQPGVIPEEFTVPHVAPLSKLYCSVNPATPAGELVTVIAVAQVLAADNVGVTGADGYISAEVDALVHAGVLAAVAPQAASLLHRIKTVLQPGVVPEELVVPHVAPLSKLYCNVNPATPAGELVTVIAVPQVLAAESVGAAGVAGYIIAVADALVHAAVLAAIAPQVALLIHCIKTVLQPGVVPEEFTVPHVAPLSKLYCSVNPATPAGEFVTVTAAAQVLVADNVGVAGVAGYIIAEVEALVHAGVLAAVAPQAAVLIHRIKTVLQPGVVPEEFTVPHVPPLSKLYCNVNPATPAGELVTVIAVPQVLAADNVGAAGVAGYIIAVADALVHAGVLAAVAPHAASLLHRIKTVLQPGVVPEEFTVPHVAPLSKLYCNVNPATPAGELVTVIAVPQVLAADNVGAAGVAGYIIAVADALAHAGVLAAVAPQAALLSHRIETVLQPGVVPEELVVLHVVPLSKLYCKVYPATPAGELVTVTAIAHVLVADNVGVAGVAGYIIAEVEALVHAGVLAAVDPQAAVLIHRIKTVLQPAVTPEEFTVPHVAPLSKLYCKVKPATPAGELVTVTAVAQVLVADNVGVAGVAG